MQKKQLSGTNQLELKSLAELSGMNFTIKDYQRGYRWTPVEVRRLLDDFAEFVKRPNKETGEFYCLQPIVVRKMKDQKYEVVDGQQRITTLNLLLQYFSEPIKYLFPNFHLYTIEYVTRPDSQAFLSNIKEPIIDSEEYIDFYFMSKAYKTIVSWFDKKADDTLRKKIMCALLDMEKIEKDDRFVDVAQNVRVIWYEVADNEKTSSVDIFTRLNIGKIPLTDAELVKAVFLNDSNYKGTDSELRKIHLSTEWNIIEQALHEDSLWYFLNRSNNPLTYSSRIEFVLDIISGRTPKSKKYHTFIFFQELIGRDGAEKTWLKIKQTYKLLDEWYTDRELYHIIGYLLELGVKIEDLMSEWKLQNKSQFREIYLRKRVKETIENIQIEELSYEDKANVKKVLLLFNILTVLQKDNSDMRFPFNRFKTEKWDIEHVCSQTDRTLEKSGIHQWCDDILEYYLGTFSINNIQEIVAQSGYEDSLAKDLLEIAVLWQSNKPDKDTADTLYKSFQSRFKETETAIPDKDSISNLALLDYTTNRSYGNAFFPIKRKRIIENDSLGVFVPIATKNLFLKYYTPKVSTMMNWTKEDGMYYLEAIVNTINNYLSSKYSSHE